MAQLVRGRAAALVVGLAAILTTGASSPRPASTTGTANAAEINKVVRSSGAGPLDAWAVSVAETAVIDEAVWLLASRCMAEQGIALEAPRVSLAEREAEERDALSRRYGPTDIEQALVSGYLPRNMAPAPTTTAPLATDTARALFGDPGHPGCLPQARTALTGQEGNEPSFQLALRMGNRAWQQAHDDPRVRSAIDDWSACMRQHGYSLADPLASGMPAGRRIATPGEIEQAVADIDCKRRTDLVEQWRRVEDEIATRLVTRLVDTARPPLLEERALIDRAVSRACGILGEAWTYGRPCVAETGSRR